MQAGMAVSNLASAIGVRTEDAALVAELKAGSEQAFGLLIAQYHQPLYTLIARSLQGSGRCGRHYAGGVREGVSKHSELPRGLQPAHVALPDRAA